MTEYPDAWIYRMRTALQRTDRITDAQRATLALCTQAIDGDDAQRREATDRLYAVQEPVILVREGTTPGYLWRQYHVITEQREAIVELVPAYLAGWKLHSVTLYGVDSWPGYTRDQIVVDRLRNSNAKHVGDLGDFRATLLAVAVSGKLPAHRKS